VRLLPDTYVDLYWLPLGEGGHFVRLNGRLYETLVAGAEHRKRQDLYHSALEVALAGDSYVIEMAPVWNERSTERGTIAAGAVGSSLLGPLRIFRWSRGCSLAAGSTQRTSLRRRVAERRAGPPDVPPRAGRRRVRSGSRRGLGVG
jgi:hypothetical protein